MKKKFNQVYQFKITLRDVKPPVWRRIQVPETYTFWDLHVAIQDAMGWEDAHLHEFEMRHPFEGEKVRIGIPDNDHISFVEIIPERKEKIADWFSMDNIVAEYTYDFGDNWKHRKKGLYIRCVYLEKGRVLLRIVEERGDMQDFWKL